ncbi:hypothetical protein [Marinobacter sp. JSM 1782161]|uniref:hypothetical protein n=1 Tax=Marinobacter sp. JSM 1782161 TaxID=2685906 RepID=UPI0014027D2E|nr:hypothetical protein [Marinobacter sp. JSM 1782161]
MKRILLALIVVVAGGAFFAHHQITSRVEDQMDKAVQMASLYGRLTYEGVSVSPDGSVAVNQIDFYPHAISDQVHIDRVALETGNPWVLYNLKQKLRDGEVPDHLALRLEGITIDLDGPLYRQMLAQKGEQSFPSRLSLAGCGSEQTFSASEQLDMGYQQDVIDLTLAYQLNDSRDSLAFTLGADFRDQTNLQLNLAIDPGSSLEGSTALGAAAMGAALKSAKVTVDDNGFNMRSQEVCAERTDMDLAAFRTHHLQAWETVWAEYGMAPSDSLRQTYKTYFENPGSTLTLSIEPYPPLTSADRNLSQDPDYLSGRLNPKVGVDGHLKPFQITKAALPDKDDSATAQAAPQTSEPAVTEATTATRQPAADNTPKPLPLNALDDHRNQSVRITLTSGETVEGRIQGVEGQRLKLQRRMYGGNMVVPIQFSAIQAVYRQ